MATNGYHQQYQQRIQPQYQQRPPLQQYSSSRGDRDRSWQMSGQHLGNNSQHEQYRGGYDDRYEVQQMDDRYGQAEQWQDRGRQEPYYEENHTQYTQQHGNFIRTDQTYGYDNRYQTNGSNDMRPPTNQPRQMTSAASERQRLGHLDTQQQQQKPKPKPRQRILQDPESPKTIPWDNPFGAFPSKKKQETSRKSADEHRGNLPSSERAESRQTNPDQRPSTSHSSRPRNEEMRPHTSHSQRSPQPASDSTQDFNFPMPKAYKGLDQGRRPNEAPGPVDASQRPVPRRAVTGPVASPYDDHSQFPMPPTSAQHRRNFSDNQQTSDTGPASRRPEDGFRGMPYEQEGQQMVGHPRPNFVAQQFANHSYDNLPRQHQTGAQSNLPVRRDVPRHNRSIDSDVPNFDAMGETPNERAEDHLVSPIQSMPPQSAYRRPEYQPPHTTQPQPEDGRMQYQTRDQRGLASPLAQFSFDLPADPSPSPRLANQSSSQFHAQNGQYSQQRSYPAVENQHGTNQSVPQSAVQHPPRTASRMNGQAQMPNSQFSVPLPSPMSDGQGYQVGRPGLAQEQQRDRDYGGSSSNERYDSGAPAYTQGNGYSAENRLPNHRAFSPDMQTMPRAGYDPRLQPRDAMNTPDIEPRGQAAQQRPQYSQPGHPLPIRSHELSARTDSSSNGTYQRLQESLPPRPAPFRPGLLNQTSTNAPSQQVQNNVPPKPPQRTSIERKPHNTVDAEANPVTIQELNALRETFKTRPDDHELGLRFAKRLVEAAKVLASENGRADPKQIAKNRERYIFDAHKIIKRLINAGYAEAMFYMADCHGQGLLGLEADPKEAFALYQSAAKLGHANSAYRVAVCCELGAEEGGGTRRDPLKAVQWYKRAATLGDTPAMYKMGMIQLKGLLGQPKNPREAISWLKRAAERADKENPHALHELGLLYESAQPSDILVRDDKYAIQLFQQAAEMGYKYSQFRLGSIYEYGLLGCPIDARMSIAWYSRAAAQGEHQSEFALSGWYLTGSGQPPIGEQPLLQQSDTEAYLWARKAASSGLAKAEYAMGYYSEVGIGCAPNVEEAKRWYYRAAAQNHPKARERLEALKKGGARMQKTRVSRSNVGKQNEGECLVM